MPERHCGAVHVEGGTHRLADDAAYLDEVPAATFGSQAAGVFAYWRRL